MLNARQDPSPAETETTCAAGPDPIVLLPTPLRAQRLSAFSPLRYPGSKRKMVPYLRSLLAAAGRPELFVEPFCGGASVSLRLLEADLVDSVILGDKDPLVSAFWHVATTDPDWLIKAMIREPVTLARWDYWRSARPRSHRNLALKCLFLNRTSFSGILHGYAGPIGGRKQESEYAIDCRFPKDALADRIRTIGELARTGRIAFVTDTSWESTIEAAKAHAANRKLAHILLYLDPPYVEKASELYHAAFTMTDHRKLAEHLRAEPQPWILSYDRTDEVAALYAGHAATRFTPTHHYTARGSRTNLDPGREVLFTNLQYSASSHDGRQHEHPRRPRNLC